MVVTDIDRELGINLAPPPEGERVWFPAAAAAAAARFSSASKYSSSLLPMEVAVAALSRLSGVEELLALSSESKEKLTGSREILWWSTSLGSWGAGEGGGREEGGGRREEEGREGEEGGGGRRGREEGEGGGGREGREGRGGGRRGTR